MLASCWLRGHAHHSEPLSEVIYSLKTNWVGYFLIFRILCTVTTMFETQWSWRHDDRIILSNSDFQLFFKVVHAFYKEKRKIADNRWAIPYRFTIVPVILFKRIEYLLTQVYQNTSSMTRTAGLHNWWRVVTGTERILPSWRVIQMVWLVQYEVFPCEGWLRKEGFFLCGE